MNPKTIIPLILIFISTQVLAQVDSTSVKDGLPSPVKDSLSKFDKFNKKAEHLFKIIPVPIISYSSEAGNVFGLAKFNLIKLSKKDTISKPSKLSEVVSFSTKGRINASVSTELIFDENNYMVLAYVNYKKNPEYLFGIGNDVQREDVEEVLSERFKFSVVGLRKIYKKLYAGIGFDYTNYFNIDTDSNSFLIKQDVPGWDGGASTGIGLALALDSRENRYNPFQGAFVIGSLMAHPSFLGSKYQFTKFMIDARKYFNPWLKHVIAIQGTTTYVDGNTPFYELAQMGGDSKMRGYYEGAYRDNVLVDAQVEYRLPVWNIFGVVAWVGTGRVASSYSQLNIDGFRMSYGAGLRIRVDSKNNTNLRIDFGFGPNGIKGTYISFAEAF